MERNNSNFTSGSTLGIVIVDGVGYRNFILSDILKQSLNSFHQIIIFSGLPASAYEVEDKLRIEIIELPVFKEPSKIWFWRKMKEVAHMQKHKYNYAGIRHNLDKNKPTTNSRRANIIGFIFKLTSIFHSESWIQYFYEMQIASLKHLPEVKQYQDFLKNNKCDLLFFTHQRPPYIAPLDYAAKALGIRTCSFIFSWDNLASKGRMAANFDSFLVWSDLMKKELLYFYPATRAGNISVVGTPQFEPYVMPEYQISAEEFQQRFSLNPNLKTICYSCGDASTSKNDGLYIETIAEAVQDKEIEDVNFVVRTSPAEDGSRFSAIQKKYDFIHWNFPKWELSRKNHPEPWSQRLPSSEDLLDLRGLLEFSNLNINMCSTMSLDFMLFDKPVINPVFGNEENGLYNDQRFLEYGHYKKVAESGGVKIVKDKKALIEAINFYLQYPEVDKENRKKVLEQQIGKPLEGTSERIAAALKEFSAS